MEVSVIIPVYNHIELTSECLKSLQENTLDTDYEVILVDDGSDAATKAQLSKLAGERVTLVTSPSNQGYAHANNLGSLYAKGKYLVLANNDLIFLPGWLPPMLAAFEKCDRPGLVGNVQYNAQTGEIDHAGTRISAKGSLLHRKKKDRGLLGTPAYSKNKVVTGACCAIPRTLYQETGGFDEAFLNGGEDVDLCLRLAKRGYKIYVANQSEVRHHVSATRKEPNLNDERNSRLLQRRWGSELANHSASSWPDRYLKQALQTKHIRALETNLLKQALPRFLTLKKGTAPAALYQSLCEQERNERHWKSCLDGLSDEEIKQKERTTYSSPFEDRYTYEGLFAEGEDATGVWLRDLAQVTIPRGTLVSSIQIAGEIAPATESIDRGPLGLAITVNDAATSSRYPVKEGPFQIDFDNAPAKAQDCTQIKIKLLGVERSNTLAYLGRILAKNKLIPNSLRERLGKYRAQKLNKRLELHTIGINGDDLLNFKENATNPLNTEYVLNHAQLGVNLTGWFKAQLGIGESARLAAKALKASGIPHNLVPLKVNCLASQGDDSLDHELTEENPYAINIFHIDAPQSADIDHHHGDAFRKNRYNIAYWAWELPDFPDEWMQYMRYFDEIWAPSNFVRDAIAIKAPVPVITVPHCIDFSIPDRDYRKELGLPSDQFLFSFAYDLNSYQERKNPKAAIEAFKTAFAGSDLAQDVGLVIKVHSVENNRKAYERLNELLKDLPNVHFIDKTLSREMTYGLMKACDSYLSLHRAEGFGLTVAESMLLEKPVISTNWSATSEFVNASNGCPVAFKLIELEKNHGPYKKGQVWADPDPQDAARHMLDLVKNPQKARLLGQEARKSIQHLYSPHRIADIYTKRLRSIALW